MRWSLAVLAVTLSVAGCGTGKRPFRIIQFCLADTGEFETMNSVLREVAAANKLPFFDNSTATEAELHSAADLQDKLKVAHPTVNVGTVGPTAMGFSVGNFADAPSQMVVGFSKANDPVAARKLSDDVVKALSNKWRIREVPNVETSGAYPLKDCDG
ncbi:MAG: hypothetical protein B7Y43_05515 [Sphingomonas sp. 28-62-20]|uniref:hypothetical protein n=1 Tax=Sphingomonas sp. 28-62-20 TaxID=1970433 RepID=UPI000BCC2B6A|nr:MAG: hypothetical protein B7Y43_05515 [Sphingomonas sp. 28-62-20]